MSSSSENCRDGITDPEKSSMRYNSVPQQNCSLIDGPVAILWDIENCCVPSNVNPEDVAGNIRKALQKHPIIEGSVMMFSAYGDFNVVPRKVRQGCQSTGVKLVDVPNGRKDAADKAILVDMFLFALDHRPPSTIILISGDIDFAPALHILGQRGYTMILVKPSAASASPALCAAGKFVWDWPTVARGEGLAPVHKCLSLPHQAQQLGTVWESGPVPDYYLDSDTDYTKKFHYVRELKPPAFSPVHQAQQMGRPVCYIDLNPDTDYMKKFHHFRELKTPTFSGTADQIQAEDWLDQVEKNFEAIHCPEEYKVRMIACLLLGEAEQWWQSVQSASPTGVVITWEDFVITFIKKYYPAVVCMERMSELTNLKQGSMTVTAYKQRFSKLCRFGTNMIPTEKLKALKFLWGLRPSIQTKLKPFCSDSYSEIHSRALIAECNEQMDGVSQTNQSCQKIHVIPPETLSVKEGRPHKKANVSAKPWRQPCSVCGKFHGNVPCRKLNRTCFRCGQAGHNMKNCDSPHDWRQRFTPQDHVPAPQPPAIQAFSDLQIKPLVHHHLSPPKEGKRSRTACKRARKQLSVPWSLPPTMPNATWSQTQDHNSIQRASKRPRTSLTWTSNSQPSTSTGATPAKMGLPVPSPRI